LKERVSSGPKGAEWRVASIVGVGLIGGSFGLALREAGFKGKLIGVSSPETLRVAFDRGVVDEALPLDEAAAQSDFIYLAQPIAKILETIDVIDEFVRPGTLISDAGSTKYAIVKRASERIHRGRFVGGHPMAGKEARGVAAAEAGLFRDRPYVLTSPDPELERWVARIGGRLAILDAAEHDRLVALVSHLPQLISTALSASLASEPGAACVGGPAALDLTRLALSPYEIWRDIFATNAGPIDAALAMFISRLEELRRTLGSPEIEREFDRAADAARTLRQRNA
jgi:prephenate dehydrogenase